MILATIETVEYIGTFLKLRGVRKVKVIKERKIESILALTGYGCWKAAGVAWLG